MTSRKRKIVKAKAKTKAKARTNKPKATGKKNKGAARKRVVASRSKKPVKRAPTESVALGEPEVTVYEVVETEVYAEPALEEENEEEEFGT